MSLNLNCSISFPKLSIADKLRNAKLLGYSNVELWWPFDVDMPNDSELQDFVETVDSAEVSLQLMNFPGGGAEYEDRGVLAVPGGEKKFDEYVKMMVPLISKLNVKYVNPMVGNSLELWKEGSKPFQTCVDNLRRLAPIVESIGSTIVIEPLSGFEKAAIKTFADAELLVLKLRSYGIENVKILFDLYHAYANDDEVLKRASIPVELIGHVQLADWPGRGMPGTGNADLSGWIKRLIRSGYKGNFGLECAGNPDSNSVVLNELKILEK